MEIDDYLDEKGISNEQIKILTIRGTKKPYIHRKIRIRIEFTDQYPDLPPKMYYEKLKGETLLHANIYDDNGEICHPVL